jgi:hypothetical protein
VVPAASATALLAATKRLWMRMGQERRFSRLHLAAWAYKTVHGICLDDDFTASYGQVVLPLLYQSAEIDLFAHTRCRRFSWVIPEMTLDCQFILPPSRNAVIRDVCCDTRRRDYHGPETSFYGLLWTCLVTRLRCDHEMLLFSMPGLCAWVSVKQPNLRLIICRMDL